ncbi:MAG: UDP-2,3-diacylglucosamine diphosphatase [Planctomycetes bacterium]|nr:UDP-2,3-diacylglucosamine diphosphatase [Planctomycetota bacterium]
MAADQALPEFELAVGALVVADLHLDVRPGAAPNADFERFVRVARGAPQLLVLGDLFDAWVGPAHAEVDAARRVIELLRDLTRGGTRVDVLAGNRDFLLEQRFERATGARVHPRGCIGRVAHQRLLFLHGDELCTLDLAYQRLKRVLRSGPLAWGLPRLPRPVALAIARRLRRASVQAVAGKPALEKEQQGAEALRAARASGCTTLVCGHAHAFRDTREGGVRWVVLDAFGGARDLARIAASGELEFSSSARA